MNPDDALRMVNLGERQDHFPAQLSAASSSVSPSRARSPSAPPCCCATSRPVRSISQPGIVVLEALARVNT
jgi:putative ABC transport system ATP-binding protein